MEGTTTQTDTTPANKDAAVMSGGPAGDHGQPMPKHGDPHPGTQAPSKTTEVIQEKFEVNGKTFSSAQEMSKYVADLERKVINPQSQPITQTIQTVQKETIDGRPVDEVMFTDPDKYTKYLETKLENKMIEQRRNEEKVKKFWSDFYTENPDLKDKEELVEALVTKNFGTWSKLPPNEIATTVAKECRSRFRRAGLLANSTQVPNNPAASLSSSGESSPSVTQERKVLTFVEEMQAKRRARANRKAN